MPSGPTTATYPVEWLRAPSHAARQARELLVAADERGTGDVEGGGKRDDRLATGGAAEPMVVLGEDRLLQVAECRPRFDAELLREHPARALVGAQRVRLPARSVQGDHELPHSRSRNGSAESTPSSSGTSSLDCPRARSASNRSSITLRRSSSSERAAAAQRSMSSNPS